MVIINIEFHEKFKGKLAEDRYFPSDEANGYYESIEQTKWKKEDDKWVVISPGYRLHVFTPEIY